MISKISSFAVVVRDEKKSARWFREKLGFEVRSREGHWVTVAPKGSRGPLFHLCKTKPLEKGNTGIAFLTEDLQKEYERLSKKWCEVHGKAKRRRLGTILDVQGHRRKRLLALALLGSSSAKSVSSLDPAPSFSIIVGAAHH